MDWQAIQAIAELAAALGVLVSLVYLSVQIRHNTISVQSSSVSHSSEVLNRVRNHIWVDKDAARIYELALSGRPAESEADQTRARMFLVTVARDYEAIYYQYMAGQFPEAMWDSWRREMLLIFSAPGGRDAIQALGGNLVSQDFSHFVAAELASIDGASLMNLRDEWDAIRARRLKSRIEAPASPGGTA